MTRLTPLRSTILVAGMTMLVAACGHEQAKSDQAIAKSAQPGLFTVPADQTAQRTAVDGDQLRLSTQKSHSAMVIDKGNRYAGKR